jgi:hypothetical protein
MKLFTSIILSFCFIFFVSCSKNDSPSPSQPPVKSSLDSGLIAYYPFNGDANDSTHNKYNLTVQGAVLSMDRHGSNNKAYHFNGLNSVMIVPAFTIGDSLASFSASVWVKPKLGGYIYNFFNAQLSNIGEAMDISKDTMTNNFDVACWITDYHNTGGSITQLLQNTIEDDFTDKWTNLVMIEDQQHITLYINGAKQRVQSSTPYVISYAYGGLIGELKQDPNSDFFEGDIDDLRFYSRTLTADEIQKLYQQ